MFGKRLTCEWQNERFPDYTQMQQVDARITPAHKSYSSEFWRTRTKQRANATYLRSNLNPSTVNGRWMYCCRIYGWS
jgi:hypothetical protein